MDVIDVEESIHRRKRYQLIEKKIMSIVMSLNPSNDFSPKHKNAKIFGKILNPVMLVFIG